MKTIEELNTLTIGTLMEHLGIHFTAISRGTIQAEMPVDHRTVQPFGRLHGGASIALAESAASAGSWALLNDDNKAVFSTEVSTSHVGAAPANTIVSATGTLLHEGKSQHIWEVIVRNQQGKTVSICRVTNTIISLK
jgi:1,4-dihydroxy-2-naphthoyl-CoA hydrolase